MLSKPGVMDRCHLGGSSASKSVLGEKPPASPMQQQQQQSTGSMNTVFSQDMGDKRFGYDDAGKENFGGGGSSGTGLPESSIEEDEGDPPAVVIYMIDPFSNGVDNCDMLRLSSLGLLRCFSQILPHLPDNVRNNIHLQLISVESIFQLSQLQSPVRRPDTLRGLAFSVYTQAAKPMQYQKDCKTLTGFGPASGSERYMAANEAKTKLVRHLHQPTHVLAPPPAKKKASMEADTASAANERTSTVLFVNYCLSEDQHWLLASCCDDRGEMLNTVVINVEIPNKTRRKKASARRVGLRKLMNWILGVMSQSLVPWRLVIGRIGRIGHGELRGKLFTATSSQ
jgi:mediator of RNA polymerase II transcription subunit 13